MPGLSKTVAGTLRGKMRQPSVDQQSTARLFQAYFAAKILVSRFVAKTWPVFRSLWRGSGRADNEGVEDFLLRPWAHPLFPRRPGDGFLHTPPPKNIFKRTG